MPLARRADGPIAAALYLLSLLLLWHAARSLGVTAIEVDAVDEASAYLRRLDAPGPLIARLTGAPGPALPGLLSAALAPAAGPLTGLRLGPAALSAAIAPVTYGVARASMGPVLSAIAALLALLVPRALVEGATLGGDGPLAALLWAGLLAHVHARGRPALAALAGALLSLALSLSASALLALPALLLYQRLTRPGAPAGHTAAPLAFGAFALLAAPVAWMATPSLWRLDGAALRAALISAASPQILPGLWRGAEVAPDTVPRFHTIATLLTSLPSATALLALAGLRLTSTDRLDRRSPALALALAALATVGLWPLLGPPGLGRFPGHFALLAPAAGLLAAAALDELAQPLSQRLRLALLAPLLGLPLLSCLQASTLSADRSLLTGGSLRPARLGPDPVDDGSALAALGPALDQAVMAPGVRVYSPEVPYEIWKTSHRLGRLRALPRPAGRPEEADLLVQRGAPPPGFELVTEARRQGSVVLALYRRAR